MRPDPELCYLDHNATTPVLPMAYEAMCDVLRGNYGNPNSAHRAGAAARYMVEKARRQIARLINAPRAETIVFTSGGSESDNLAIKGTCFAARRHGKGSHLVIAAADHKAVLDAAKDLRDLHGFDLTIVNVDGEGRVQPGELLKALRDDTILVSIMLANNEVGSINDIESLARAVREKSRAVFHCDAVQAFGKIEVSVERLDVDLLSLSAHKLGGPKGIGALYIRDEIQVERQVSGGSQEQDLRAGTENVAGIAGFAAAAGATVRLMEQEAPRLQALRETFWLQIKQHIPTVLRNSPADQCLPNTLNISLPGTESQALVRELDAEGFAVSSGSACTSGGETARSHVLLAMGMDDIRVGGALRISLGSGLAESHAVAFAEALTRCFARPAVKEMETR